jgi:hypothetical protein
VHVVKIGGSLLKYSKPILELLRDKDVIIVPGGGVFADTIRNIYEEYSLSDLAAHKMAILAMDQYGLYLSDISGIPFSRKLDTETPFIFLPSQLLEEEDPFEPSWDITSDTIACYIARLIGAERLIILTDVDGVFIDGKRVDKISAEELLKYGETCVDKELPNYLIEYSMDCLVVNGKKHEQIKKALKGLQVGTLIVH